MRVIRMAKAAIKHDATPTLISFNIEALALGTIARAVRRGPPKDCVCVVRVRRTHCP